jgi:hypothetical protein
VAAEILIASVVAAAVALMGSVMVTAWGTRQALAAARAEATRERTLQLLRLLAPGAVATADDPRALLAWQPIVALARKLFPEESRLIDDAAGGKFPFTADYLQAAHARWTADWLAWEGAHDTEYKLRAAALEDELGPACMTPLGRARLDALYREKLERYQRRYEDYTRVSKALQAFTRQ